MPIVPAVADFGSLSLRVPWPHEAQHFTTWLRENLGRLSHAIGVPLIGLEGKAVAAGRICDLLARDARDGSSVVIENQLEPSNDEHLGRILSYVASVNARAVVWIATGFAEPHRAAMRWLDANTGPAVGFYAVRIRLLRVGASEVTPVFDVLERPSGRGQSTSTSEVNGASLGFAAGFWAAHLQRFPDEHRLSRPVGAHCRWRSTQPKGVVIGQLVRQNSVSVFVRGRYGVTLEAVWDVLAPHARRLEPRLGVLLRGVNSAVLAEKALHIDATNSLNWKKRRTGCAHKRMPTTRRFARSYAEACNANPASLKFSASRLQTVRTGAARRGGFPGVFLRL